MTVDFEIAKAPRYGVASLVRPGPWMSEDMMRPYFSKILAWAKRNNLQTGKWIYTELVGPTAPSERRLYEASLEIKVRKKTPEPEQSSKIKIQVLPAATVARIKFNPELVSSRLVYHGLESWLEWRKRYGEYERSKVFWTREIYQDDPWRSKAAWKNIEVQVPIRKL
jgi:effector-binding domain-containing protein